MLNDRAQSVLRTIRPRNHVEDNNDPLRRPRGNANTATARAPWGITLLVEHVVISERTGTGAGALTRLHPSGIYGSPIGVPKLDDQAAHTEGPLRENFEPHHQQ